MTQLDLRHLNLNKSETNVYYSLLKDSSQTVVELNKKLNISRTRLYAILEKLISSKLVSKKNQAYYSENPEILYEKLKEEERHIFNQKKTVKHLIEISKQPKIKAFLGEKAYKDLNNELRKKLVKKGYIITNSDLRPKKLNSRRSREKFIDDIILNFTNKAKKKGKRTEKQLHYKHQTGFSSILIFDKNVAFYSSSDKNEYGLLVADENIANLLKDVVDSIIKEK